MFQVKTSCFIIFLLIGFGHTQDVNLNILQNIQNNPNLLFFTYTTNLATNLPVIENSEIGKGVKYTIFAPSDQAFGKIGQLSPEAVNNIIRYHIIPIEAKSSSFNNIQYQPTLIGSPESVKLGIPNAKQKIIIKNDGGITVGNGNITAKVISADNLASNGVIHIIDTIITIPGSPMSAMNQILDINYFGQVITGANLANTFEDFAGITIFAPSSEALNQAPKELLSTNNLTQLTKFINYHVVSRVIFSGTLIGSLPSQESKEGSTLRISNEGNVFSVNNAKVIKPDILLNNGVLHIIDKYLVPDGISIATPGPTTTIINSSPTSTSSTGTISTTSTSTSQPENKNSIIISSVLGGVIGMAVIGIGLLIFFCKRGKKKKRSNSVVNSINNISATNSHPYSPNIQYSPNERESHSPTNVTQRSSNFDDTNPNPYFPNHEPVGGRNYSEIVDNESNVGGSGSRNPLSSVHSETSSVSYFSKDTEETTGGAPYNPSSNTTSVYSSNSNPAYPNPAYPNPAYPTNTNSNSNSNSNTPIPAYPTYPFNPAYPTRSPASGANNSSNNRNNFYSPHDFPHRR